MPGRPRREVTVDRSLCRRCQDNEPTITIRTEPLCATCFAKYVSTKAVKRMESFRVRHAEAGSERILLLPLSLGACSTTLIHVLSQHLAGQSERTGRTGFKLHILHVDGTEPAQSSSSLNKVRECYPQHSYSSLPLADALSLEGIHELLNLTESQENTAEALSIAVANLNSATSRDDILQLLQRKLVVDFAKRHNCEAILWGDSTTKLAERTLAETAKGRGFNLPWTVSDGESPHGIPFYFPMRDLLSKEIVAFTTMTEPPLADLVVQREQKRMVSTKNTTIDELMKQYFESVEQEYPGIVANVVKTTSTGKEQTLLWLYSSLTTNSRMRETGLRLGRDLLKTLLYSRCALSATHLHAIVYRAYSEGAEEDQACWHWEERELQQS
ncbi:Cytoplasmic tRNA 2-thiolation protein 2 [Recurvomyces mirabilis]|uniref:Cytoplasmic tRNA 2-thiolation protein 2 n=1 Tax=Recurvomyces mirabilis TaxID=574656 RepID=A0AAE1C6M9_9PEZI|nr:Cytoplasmic tRNA 2-thiolation protein 2 [Recurvomyces mirabilis]KAK5162195.1 Cytoplasmic tRNA 2-thiolation protein 2 [Recurvomyces mirabilis]